ncbi:MAG: hypothetical protein GY765_32785 [bacterium]|nr:hypothetical protein [bacterium]
MQVNWMRQGKSHWILIFLLFVFAVNSHAAFRITQTVFCGPVPVDCSAPPAHTGPFNIYHEKAHVWIDWEGYETGKVYRYEWYNPAGTLCKTYENTRSYNSNGCSWANIRSQQLLDDGPGTWTVKFYYDGNLYYTGTFVFEDPGNFEYMYYKPNTFQPGNGILVAVHSSGFNPVSYFHFFKDMAETHGVVLLAPYYNQSEWSRYGRIFTDEYRGDTRLQDMIDTVAAASGADKSKLHMYGQSAGGQFVHRFLLAHPGNIERIVISSPGWWSFPRQDWAYPYGIGPHGVLPPDITFDLHRVNEVHKKVILGELDIEIDDTVNQYHTANLQGLNRLQRSAHWVNRMNLYSFENSLPLNLRYEIIPGAEHVTVRAESKDRTEAFLFTPYEAPLVTGTLQIENDVDTINSRIVTLTVKCKAAEGAGKVAISTTSISSSYRDYRTVTWNGQAGALQTAQIPFILTGKSRGTKFLYCRIKDAGGNVSDMFGDAVVLADSSAMPCDYYYFHGSDYNGDGMSQAAIYRPRSGLWCIKGEPSIAWGTATDIPVPGDYDGNGTTDIAVYRPVSGRWCIKGRPSVAWGAAGDIPVPGDYDGNGTTDIAVYRPSNGRWCVRGVPSIAWGTATDIPVPGDYDGNGTTDIAIYRPSNGRWCIRGVPSIAWGTSTDIPVPVDYDGNGTSDIAIYRPSRGLWCIKGNPSIPWGAAGDIPIPADYNGDGTCDIAVFRPSAGLWAVKTLPSFKWGVADDIPLVSH